jgi:hypothetical protein
MKDTSQRGLKKGYVGKAEFFAVYLPDNGKVYMIAVDEAPRRTDMTLRFKSAYRAGARQPQEDVYRAL